MVVIGVVGVYTLLQPPHVGANDLVQVRKGVGFVAVVDPDAKNLQTWVASGAMAVDAPNAVSGVSGVVVCGGWGWPTLAANADASAAFAGLSSQLATLDKAVHMYPPHALHLTLATLSSFKNPHDAYGQALPGPERNHFRRTWARALGEHLRPQVHLGPIKLVAERLELSSAAGFLVFTDPSGRVASIRAAVRLALRTVMLDAIISGLDKRTLNSVQTGLHIPDIIHSTVLRFAAPPTNPVRFQQGFASIAQAWQPIEVQIEVLALVEEIVPFMHGYNRPELQITLHSGTN